MEQEREANETALQDQLEATKERLQQAVSDLRESEKQRKIMEEVKVMPFAFMIGWFLYASLCKNWCQLYYLIVPW